MRDFLTTNKNEINLVYNLHCPGNLFITPINADSPNDAETVIPKTMKFFNSLVKDTKWPQGFRIGPTSKVLGFATGGSAGDWINTQLGIPAAEIEIGRRDEHDSESWMP
jgi:hypothetical protein